MIRTLFFQPLGPALILALGGLSFWPISWLTWRFALARLRRGPRMVSPPAGASDRRRRGVALAAHRGDPRGAESVLEVAAAHRRRRDDPLASGSLERGHRPDPPAPDGRCHAPLFDDDDAADGLAHLPAAGPVERTLWLGAAAITFVCSANMLTVASSWLLLDACVLLRLWPGRQAEPAGRAWSLLMLVTPLLLFAAGDAWRGGPARAPGGWTFRPARIGPALAPRLDPRGRLSVSLLADRARRRQRRQPDHRSLDRPGDGDLVPGARSRNWPAPA